MSDLSGSTGGSMAMGMLMGGLDRVVVYAAASGVSKIVAIDVTIPSNMVELDSFSSANILSCNNVEVDKVNKVAYITSPLTPGNITAIDISNPRDLSEFDDLDTTQTNTANGIAIDTDTDTAYLITGTNDTLVSVDISDPTNMAQLDYVTATPQLETLSAVKVDTTNSILYAYTKTNTLSVYDVSDPSDITYLGGITDATLISGYDIQLDVARGIAYLGSSTWSVVSIDISTPATPIILDTYRFPDSINPNYLLLDLVGEIAYVANGYGDAVHSIDISDPENLSLLDTLTSATKLDGAQSMAFHPQRDILFVANVYGDSITEIDISDPSNMIIGQMFTSANLNNVVKIVI